MLTIDHGISGLGPRTVLLVAYLAITVVAERVSLKKTQKTGEQFNIRLTIFEQNPEERACCGEAFQPDCQATLNSTVPGPIKIRNQDNIPTEFADFVESVTDLGAAVAKAIGPNAAKRIEELKKMNLVAACMLKNALLPSGKLDTSVPYATRNEIGKMLQNLFAETKQFVKEHVPELEIVDRCSTKVLRADLTDRNRPALIVQGSLDRPKDERRHVFNFVHFNNGIPLHSQLSGAEANMCYSDLPNRDLMRQYLAERNLLDDQGFLKPSNTESSIGLLGLGLSAGDYFSILINFTKIFSLSNDHEVLVADKTEAAKYPGLLTFISPTDGDVFVLHITGSGFGRPARP
ncbi:hypothetical protein HIM_11987 [Hirsutella minnesotensis 3608]|uniref:Uncharacterized protein n=1 Tax=Hirsutella minnesotensis 3608 TaxID=1043627 RepID=A0A0F7ZWA2_9HYPO|nr:hypothetical protein HIM_11987 [Hirsutella minnesotensis 3608]